MNRPQAIGPILSGMNLMHRAGPFGAGLVLGASGLIAVAVLHGHHSTPTANAKPAKQASVRTISNTDPDAAKRVYARAKDSVPLLPGKGLRITYGVDATPKLLVIDADGVVRGSYVGWGLEIPGAVSEELKRCLKHGERR